MHSGRLKACPFDRRHNSNHGQYLSRFANLSMMENAKSLRDDVTATATVSLTSAVLGQLVPDVQYFTFSVLTLAASSTKE